MGVMSIEHLLQNFIRDDLDRPQQRLILLSWTFFTEPGGHGTLRGHLVCVSAGGLYEVIFGMSAGVPWVRYVLLS